MEKNDIKKVLAGVSLVGLLAGGVAGLSGCATTEKSSCTGKKQEKSSCSGEKSNSGQSSCSGEGSCSGK